jgi:hypothetical protein
MIFDPLYSALDFFLDGDSPQAVIREGKMVLFKTANGFSGLIVRTKQGDRKIVLGDKVIYTVEKNVFDLIDFESLEPPAIEIYLPKLILAWHSPLQEKSKIFVQKIIEGISQIVHLNLIEDLNGEIEKTYGIFTFKKDSDFK